jgi:hypothetical protein
VADVPSNFVKLRLTGPDGQIETPWAEPVGDYFRLDNLPWFAYGISDDDIVEATPTENAGVYEFVRVHEPSGNRLVRIIFDGSESDAPVLERLLDMGCHYEGLNKRLIAVNIPPTIEFDSVYGYLTELGTTWEHANPRYEQLHPMSD